MFPQMVAAALFCNHKYSGAAQYFHKSYKIKPDPPEFQDNLARSLIGSGQLDSAEILLKKHTTGRQKSALHDHLWALFYLYKRSYQQAADAASRELELYDGHHDALLIRGKARIALLQSESALQDFDAILAEVPAHIEAVEGRAAALLELGRTEELKQQYYDLLKLNPADVACLKGLAELPNMTEECLIDLETRIDHAGAALSQKKDKPASNLNFARYEIAMHKGKTAEAMQHLSRANAQAALSKPFDNTERPHSTHGILTPNEPDASKTEPMRLAA